MQTRWLYAGVGGAVRGAVATRISRGASRSPTGAVVGCLAQRRPSEIPAAARRLRGCDLRPARARGDQLLELPRAFADRISISGGIEFAAAQLERAPFESGRRAIDVSGDGTNNAGRDVKLARDDAVAKGIVINGLVILSDRPVPWNAEHTNPPGGLEKYYQDNVKGGPGSFVMVAEDFQSFGKAIIKKMIAEIALLQVAPRIIMR